MRKKIKDGAYTIVDAEIIDNIPYCPMCNSIVGTGDTYNQILYKGNSYTEFTKYCSNPKCFCKIKYQSEIDLDGTNRFSFKDGVEVISDGCNSEN